MFRMLRSRCTEEELAAPVVNTLPAFKHPSVPGTRVAPACCGPVKQRRLVLPVYTRTCPGVRHYHHINRVTFKLRLTERLLKLVVLGQATPATLLKSHNNCFPCLSRGRPATYHTQLDIEGFLQALRTVLQV